MKGKIKAVIFDMDGVLIEAKDWHYEALNRALRLFGSEISRDDHLTTYDGLPTRRKLEMLSAQEGLPLKLHPFINEMKQIYTIELIHQLCRPQFHHEYALSRLRAEGYRMALASNSVRLTIDLMMEKSQLNQYLEFKLSNEDVTQGKPAPDIYLKAMDRLGVRPDETLVVEDNEHGIKSALASGAHLLAVKETHEVNYWNIRNRINSIENPQGVTA